MSLDGQYDPDNIFAKILRGDLPCVKVYEDAHVLAFMDIFPQAPGHVLVVPREAARNALEMTDG
ncbi:MAG: histidine triad (HIT) family protein, partial [Maricaulis maris]